MYNSPLYFVLFMIPRLPPRSTLFPYTTLFRSLSRQMTTSTTSIDIMGLQDAYANLHTDQERDYFMQRYHDVISSFGGKTSYDADNRPLLVMRSEERFSRNAETDLVCRLLLEKKKTIE